MTLIQELSRAKIFSDNFLGAVVADGTAPVAGADIIIFQRPGPNCQGFVTGSFLLHRITRVIYTPTLQKDKGEELGGLPVLYGMEVDGKLCLIYSPYDLEGGWNEVRYPLSRGYMPESAKQLGANIIMYVMTH